ncbi:hypothetical protein D3C80_585740 [compost metagenome]
MQLLALGECELQLGPALFVEIDFQRHERHAFAVDAVTQTTDLALRQEQLAAAARLVVEAVGLQIFRQVAVDQPDLLAFVRRIGFGDIGLAVAQRLHLGTSQHQACLIGVDDLVVEPGLAVFRNDLVDHALAAFGCHQTNSIPLRAYPLFFERRKGSNTLFDAIPDTKPVPTFAGIAFPNKNPAQKQ